MTDPITSCPSCGARIRSSAGSCDLCGYAIESAQNNHTDEAAALDEARTYCNECGAENPGGAKFCNRCGKRLATVRQSAPPAQPEAVTDAPEPQTEPSSSGIGKQVTLLVGGAVLIVMALYMITLVSKQNVSTGGAQAAIPPSATSLLDEHDAEPLAAETSAQADDLRAAIQQADGEQRRSHQRALVDLLYNAGRADLAAIEAQYVAEETGDAQDWRDAGDLYFQWTESADPLLRSDLAHLTMFAYERVLEQNPDLHDVRSNVAWVAQYDVSDPMRAIDEINYILEREPDHLQANFNRGYFLMRINRFDQASDQMEHVLELAGENSALGQQASTLIQIIREEQDRLRGNR